MIAAMSPKKLYSFFIDPALAEGLKVLKQRDGIPESEQIRRAVEAWLKRKGVGVKKAERKRAGMRKRS